MITKYRLGGLFAFFALVVGGLAVAQEPGPGVPLQQQLQVPNPPEGVEPQTRGPIHEAFAQPLDVTPEPGQAIPKQPPPPINELPPEDQPDAANVQWVPGYWAWDADRNDF